MSRDTILKEGVEQNNLITEPFRSKYLDEEKEDAEGERIQVRINPEERERLEFLKTNTNYGQDAKVIKHALIVYENVIKNLLGCKVANDLSAQDRRRPSKKQT